MVAYVFASLLVAAQVQRVFFGHQFSDVPYTIIFTALIVSFPCIGYRSVCAVRHLLAEQQRN